MSKTYSLRNDNIIIESTPGEESKLISVHYIGVDSEAQEKKLVVQVLGALREAEIPPVPLYERVIDTVEHLNEVYEKIRRNGVLRLLLWLTLFSSLTAVFLWGCSVFEPVTSYNYSSAFLATIFLTVLFTAFTSTEDI